MSAMPATPAKTTAEATQATAVNQITPWIERFHSQYPMGGLVTMLAQVHGGQYIVQATLSVGGVNLTSGLAEAATLAEAEAIAQGIALDRFGLEKLAPVATSVAASPALSSPALSSPAVAAPVATPAVPTASQNGHAHSPAVASDTSASASQPVETAATAAAAPAIAAPNTASNGAAPAVPAERPAAETPVVLEAPMLLSDAPVSTEEAVAVEAPMAIAAPVTPALETPALETPALEKSAKGKPAKGKKAKPKPKSKAKTKPSAATSPDPATSITDAMPLEAMPLEDVPLEDMPQEEAPKFVADWSDDLAQIQVELKRLGWDSHRSSEYLQRTYGKPSLDYITDHSELMDFLSYLRALPTHFDAGQFDEPEPAALDSLEKPGLEQPNDPLQSNGPDLNEPETEVNIPAGYEQPAPMAAPPVVEVAPQVNVMDNGLGIAATLPEPDFQPSEMQPEMQPPTSQPSENQPAPVEEVASHDFGGLSRDDMMQQSAAECKRLKWTNRQGSNFLKSRYDKPTRKELTDHELWDFLQYLSSIAPVEDTVKEKLPF